VVRRNIIELANRIIQKEYEFKNIKIDTNLLEMFQIASYLEKYLSNFKISIYSTKFLFNISYFEEVGKLILRSLCERNNPNIYFNNYNNFANQALLKILFGSQNMLILFDLYGYNTLKNNIKFIDLDLNKIFKFKFEALRYFALNNLYELEIYKKRTHLFNINDYIKIIFKGASLI